MVGDKKDIFLFLSQTFVATQCRFHVIKSWQSLMGVQGQSQGRSEVLWTEFSRLGYINVIDVASTCSKNHG